MNSETWLLFLAQLPASPSSARVALWRRLRVAGAASVLNGAWVLPRSDKHTSLFAELADTVREHGGSATVFTTQNLSPNELETILSRFRADRAAEYKEFAERAQSFLAEIQRESEFGKFTFAELEEIEDDFNKLSAWLEKIRARDFFPDDQAEETARIIAEGNEALRVFAEAVYRQEGVGPSAEDSGA